MELTRLLLVEELGIQRLTGVVGSSMGEMQAFQLAVSAPALADRVVALADTARCHLHGVARLEGQLAALFADPVFADGEYQQQPTTGLSASAPSGGRGCTRSSGGATSCGGRRTRKRPSSRRWPSSVTTSFPGADANDVVLHCRTWQRHDVGTTPGFDGDTAAALASIDVPVLVMPGATDLYFPVGDAELEARSIPNATFLPIPSLWGHPAGAGGSPADAAFVNDAVRRFFAGEPIQEAKGLTAVPPF